MKIRVTGNGHNISIPIPTRLIFSKTSVKIYLKLARTFSSKGARYLPEHVENKAENWLDKIPEEIILALCAEIMRIKKKHGHWNLVEVHTSDGEHIEITL
jgi:hypothetical protein